MRSFGYTVMRTTPGWLAAALAVACLSAPGGEPPPAEKKPGEEKAWVFVSENRRDPFTFHGKLALPVTPPPTQPGVKNLTQLGPLDPAEIQKKKSEAEEWYVKAEDAFMLESGRDIRPSDVVNKCDKGLDVLKDVADPTKYPDQSAVRELVQVRERLLELRRAGERVRQRQEVERKFRDLNLRLTGVVARAHHSQAIVNGKIVGKGEAVAASENNDVVVDEILPDQVIFLFQGYKMALTLSDVPVRR